MVVFQYRSMASRANMHTYKLVCNQAGPKKHMHTSTNTSHRHSRLLTHKGQINTQIPSHSQAHTHTLKEREVEKSDKWIYLNCMI